MSPAGREHQRSHFQQQLAELEQHALGGLDLVVEQLDRALEAVEPDVILMDSPCSALAPISKGASEELMLDLKRNYSIVIVTHNMQQAARVSDRTAFYNVDKLEEGKRVGKLVEFAPTEKIFTAPDDKRTEEYVTGKFG